MVSFSFVATAAFVAGGINIYFQSFDSVDYTVREDLNNVSSNQQPEGTPCEVKLKVTIGNPLAATKSSAVRACISTNI